MKARFLATATACFCALLLAACDGIGTSIHADNPYGGLGGWTGDGSSGGADSSGSSSLGFDAGSLLGFSNAGDVETILVLLSGTGENQADGADGTFAIEFSADDIGLPAGGTVTLTITGNGVDYCGSTGASADGTISFEVPRIVTGTTVTVTLTVKASDGSITATGTKTQQVTAGACDFSIAMTGTAPAPAPTPTPPPVPVPADLVSIPAGTFMMGCTAGADTGADTQKPVHSVTLTRAFSICDHEVTQAEYETYCSYDSSDASLSGFGPDYPAYEVNWYDALVYCNRRSMAEGLTPCYAIGGSTDPADWPGVQSTGGKYRGPDSSTAAWNNAACDFTANGYRLPTEAEWEYAARAGDSTTDAVTWSGTSSSSSLGDYAWYGEGPSGDTHPVKTKLANANGLYDMSGNVNELCWDWFGSYGSSAVTDPTGPASGSRRVARGGAFNSAEANCTVSCRPNCDPDLRTYILGFRVCRTVTSP